MKFKWEQVPDGTTAGATFEYNVQKERIKKIIKETNRRLKLLVHLPTLLENEGQILRKFLNKTEVDFIVMVCKEQEAFTKTMVENRSDLELIFNMLEKINLHEGRGSHVRNKALRQASYTVSDYFDIFVAYSAEIIFNCEPLLAYLETLEATPEVLMESFIDSMAKLEQIVIKKLSVTAAQELQRENDLKNAYRSSMMLSQNIGELEELLEKQRQELGREQDRKEAVLEDLAEKTSTLKEKCKREIDKIVTDTEITMMRDVNKSAERQEELSKEAAESTQQYNTLLEDHLSQEKLLRAKRLKVEAQLASWVAKYDNDIGERQAEYDELEKNYKDINQDLNTLQDKFDEQEDEYLALMKEKEEEEQKIMEEKAWIFLQNRSARRIQRYWRAYRARKLARKKARKSKKKGGKSPRGRSPGGKSPRGSAKKKKDKKTEEKTTLKGGPDPNALLSGQFGEAFQEIDNGKSNAFEKKDVEVDLLKE